MSSISASVTVIGYAVQTVSAKMPFIIPLIVVSFAYPIVMYLYKLLVNDNYDFDERIRGLIKVVVGVTLISVLASMLLI